MVRMITILLAAIDSAEERGKVEQLYYTYKDHMMGIAYSILGDRHTAEDAVQQAFLKVIKYLNKFDEVECHQTRRLIVIMIRSTSFDIYRSRKKSKEVSLDELIDIPDQDGELPDSLITRLEYSEVLGTVQQLPEQARDILTLMYVEDLPVTEIADILNISESAAKKRLQRAREALRAALGERSTTNE